MQKQLFKTKSNPDTSSNFSRQYAQSKESFLSAKKAKNLHNFEKHNLPSDKKHSVSISNHSNLNNLKQEIKILQNSQFLSLKYRPSTESEHRYEIKYLVTGKQFMTNKKIPYLQKLKLSLQRRGRIFLNLDRRNFEETSEYNCLNYLEVKDINTCIKQQGLKKKQTPNIVKKYYRLQSSKNMLMNHISQRQTQNQIRGRSLKSSASSRPDKENFMIYYF